MTDPFEQLAERIDELRKTSDSSEFKHILDFVADQVDNVLYDFRTGCYDPEADAPVKVLRQQIVGSLQELGAAAEAMKTHIFPDLKTWVATHPELGKVEEVEAETVEEAAKSLLFVYYAGDCDHGADKVEEIGPGLWEATRKGSPDYFHIKVKE
jgi:hypothetical protein